MRFLLPLFLILVVYFFLRSIVRSFLQASVERQKFESDGRTGPASSRPVKLGKMEKDPSCGTYVDVETSVRATVGGTVQYFCSEECLNKYRREH